MSVQRLSIPEAIEVFVRGFCFMKSFARPRVAERIAGLWVLRDAPTGSATQDARGCKQTRKTEVIAHGSAPQDIVRRIRGIDCPDGTGGLGWHFVCHIHEPDAPFQEIRAAYKALGYRALATEWMFVHDLAEIPELGAAPPVRRVRTAAEAEMIRMAANRRRQIRPSDLAAEPAPQRLYAVMTERRVFGWVSSIPVGRSAWVANLYVKAEQRGKGFGRALMSSLLTDDRAHGLEASVLLASTDGARLYPHLGYRQIGVLQMFSPLRRLD